MAGDVTFAVVSGRLPNAPLGNSDFIKSGFGTPRACIVLASEDDIDDVNVGTEGVVSIGFSDFTNHHCIAHQDEHDSAKVDCDAIKSNTTVYNTLNIDASTNEKGTASAITDGVRLTDTQSAASNSLATVILVGGADGAAALRRVPINSSQDGTATANIGGVDGDDKLIFFIGTDVAAEDGANPGINNSFGVCHLTGSDAGGWTFTQRCMGWASDHNNVDGSPSAIISTDRALDILTETGGQNWGLEVTGYVASTGVLTLTTRDAGAGANMEIYLLALDLDNRKAKVGTVDSPTAGATWSITGVGFKPQYVGLGINSIDTVDTIKVDTVQATGMGISSNTGNGEETCHSWYNEDAVATTNTNNLFRSRVIDYRVAATPTSIVFDMSHLSFDSDGWTYTINTENNIVVDKWPFWAVEEAAAVTPIGTGDLRFEVMTMAAAGEQPHEGVGALGDLEAMALASVGVAGEVGISAPTLEIFELTAIGEQPHKGIGTPSLEVVILTAAGLQIFKGVGAPDLEVMVLTASGVQKLLGVGAPNFEAMSLAAKGLMLPAGTAVLDQLDFVMVAVGELFSTGVGAPLLEVLVLTTAGTAGAPEGAGAPLLQDFILTAAGVADVVGTGGVVIQPMVLAAVGAQVGVAVGSSYKPIFRPRRRM